MPFSLCHPLEWECSIFNRQSYILLIEILFDSKINVDRRRENVQRKEGAIDNMKRQWKSIFNEKCSFLFPTLLQYTMWIFFLRSFVSLCFLEIYTAAVVAFSIISNQILTRNRQSENGWIRTQSNMRNSHAGIFGLVRLITKFGNGDLYVARKNRIRLMLAYSYNHIWLPLVVGNMNAGADIRVLLWYENSIIKRNWVYIFIYILMKSSILFIIRPLLVMDEVRTCGLKSF